MHGRLVHNPTTSAAGGLAFRLSDQSKRGPALHIDVELDQFCTGSGFTASGTSGKAVVYPTVTTSYSLTCSGNSGSATALATVTVTTRTGNTGSGGKGKHTKTG